MGGLAMYFSYFLLFFKLFWENYVTQTRKRSNEPAGDVVGKTSSITEVTRKMSRHITNLLCRSSFAAEFPPLLALRSFLVVPPLGRSLARRHGDTEISQTRACTDAALYRLHEHHLKTPK